MCVVFKGEIYNYQQLRSESKQTGHTLKTQCDTEVIAHLYEECGEQLAGKLNGMFAIGLSDKQALKLVLIRDRLVQKSLYYAKTDCDLVFASEFKAMRTAQPRSRSIDHEGLNETQLSC